MHDGINRKNIEQRTTDTYSNSKKKKTDQESLYIRKASVAEEGIGSVFHLCFRDHMMDTSRVVIHTQGEIFSVLAGTVRRQAFSKV